MASIKRGRRELEILTPIPSLSIDPQTGELRFGFKIGAYYVSMTRRERDKILNAWRVFLEELENGKKI